MVQRVSTKEKKKRLPRPACPKCTKKMTHFVEGRVDTWICTNPACPRFDTRLSVKCPACGTKRMRTSGGALWVCLNPDCETYKGDVMDSAETAALEEQVREEREAIEGVRAKRGQGTATAARRRREAKAKAIAPPDEDPTGEAFNGATASPSRQTRFLTEVERTEPVVSYEEFFHPSTKVRFRRRVSNGDDPLLNAKVDREERVLRLLKRLRGPKSARQGTDLANELLTILEGDGKLGADWQYESEDVPMVQWSNAVYRVGPIKKESWTKQVQTWQKALAWKPKRGSKGRTIDEAAKAKHEETRGKIRIKIQNGMKKVDRKQLVDGDDFEVAYIQLHGSIKREVWPGDDQDPKDGMQAPVAEWQRSAYPDIAQA